MGVNLADLIHKGGVFDGVEGNFPEEIYRKVTSIMSLPESISSSVICDALCAREKIMSTAVGNGIALPHCRVPVIKEENEQRICIVYLKNPLKMNAPDERDVTTMFIILAQNQPDHLFVLSALVGLLQKSKFKKLLANRAGEAEILNAIRELS